MTVFYQSFESGVKVIMQGLKDVDGDCRMCHLLYIVLLSCTRAGQRQPFFSDQERAIMKNAATAMVVGSFAADSLALGAHWIYDTTLIQKEFGRVDTLLAPRPDSYHPAKKKGEFTHYGDQTFVLLESLASQGSFQGEDFSARWKALFQDYPGYYDKATKATLKNLADGMAPRDAGSRSSDLAGASRVAPLVYSYQEDLDALIEAARDQTMMTHNQPQVIDAGVFFAHTAWLVLQGEDPVSAMEKVVEKRFAQSPIAQWFNDGLVSKDTDSVAAISKFGQSCHTDDALPGVVHLIAKYPANLEEALVQSVMAGGDSAARGMVVGMILGAHLGYEGIPSGWVSGLKRTEEIMQLLDRIMPSR